MIDFDAVITCPQCNFSKSEKMPPDTWVIIYKCTSCGAVLRPKVGDCCVYCSYSDKYCPSKQREIAEKEITNNANWFIENTSLLKTEFTRLWINKTNSYLRLFAITIQINENHSRAGIEPEYAWSLIRIQPGP